MSNTEDNAANPASLIEDEVKQLEGMKDDWWNPNGKLTGLHKYNELRIPYVQECVMNKLGQRNANDVLWREFKLLDVGCGGGIMTEGLAKLGIQTTGIDVSKELITVAKDHLALDESLQNNLNYEHISIEDYSEEHANEYDVVLASEVLEHITSTEIFIEKCVKCTKPGGILIFTTYNKTQLAKFYGIFLYENVFKCLPKNAHNYELFITPEEVSAILEKYNCKTRNVQGTYYTPIGKKWTKSSTNKICYMLSAIKGENAQTSV